MLNDKIIRSCQLIYFFMPVSADRRIFANQINRIIHRGGQNSEFSTGLVKKK